MIERDEVCRLVGQIWGLMLGLDVGAATVPPPPAGALAGSVPVRGAWEGRVVLRCDPTLARLAAARMFGVPAEEVTAEQTHDALGELTNMVGGNLKSLLPGSSSLGLPAVAAGRECPAEPCLVRVAYQCAGLPFEAAVFGCPAA
jgi:chemotaxis protein CheX